MRQQLLRSCAVGGGGGDGVEAAKHLVVAARSRCRAAVAAAVGWLHVALLSLLPAGCSVSQHPAGPVAAQPATATARWPAVLLLMSCCCCTAAPAAGLRAASCASVVA